LTEYFYPEFKRFSTQYKNQIFTNISVAVIVRTLSQTVKAFPETVKGHPETFNALPQMIKLLAESDRGHPETFSSLPESVKALPVRFRGHRHIPGYSTLFFQAIVQHNGKVAWHFSGEIIYI
jgi:hypothetical protein